MIPPLPWVRIGLVVALALMLFGAGWCVRNWQAEAELATLHATQATALQKLAEANNDAAQKAVYRQQKLEAANSQVDSLQGELTHAQADNDRLRAAVAAGTRVVRIAAACPANPGSLPAAPAAASVDHAPTVELTPVVGQDVLSIRAGIVADQGALTALQQYVRTVCHPEGS